MPFSLQDSVDYYRNRCRALLRERKCILAVGPPGAITPWVKLIRDLGAELPLVLTYGRPHQPLAKEFICCSLFREISDDPVTALREYSEALMDPNPDVRRTIEEYDRDKTAIVLTTQLSSEIKVADRQPYGARLQKWIDLEDKTIIDSFFDYAGVPRGPSRIVTLEGAQVRRAAREFDHGLGTAWVGDARDGIHFGANLFRWVRTESQLLAAFKFFEKRCDRVRIMPFYEGLPCSIHGMVFSKDVAVFRPVENIILRSSSGRLTYTGTATFWDPAPVEHDAMRAIARITGHALRRFVGYRGIFGIDGILSSGMFIPTELNSRMAAGAVLQAATLPDVPLALLDMALRQGEDWEFRPSVIESLILDAAATFRRGAASCHTRSIPTRFGTVGIVDNGKECRAAQNGETSDAYLSVVSAGKGSSVTFHPNHETIPVGPSITIRILRAFRLAKEIFGLRKFAPH
jgi:hypothetical protein